MNTRRLSSSSAEKAWRFCKHVLKESFLVQLLKRCLKPTFQTVMIHFIAPFVIAMSSPVPHYPLPACVFRFFFVSPQSLLGCLISSSFFLHAFHLSFAGFTGFIYKFTNFYFHRLEYLGITLTCFFALLSKSDLCFFHVSINIPLQNVVTHCFGCLVILQFILRKLTYSRSFLTWK